LSGAQRLAGVQDPSVQQAFSIASEHASVLVGSDQSASQRAFVEKWILDYLYDWVSVLREALGRYSNDVPRTVRAKAEELLLALVAEIDYEETTTEGLELDRGRSPPVASLLEDLIEELAGIGAHYSREEVMQRALVAGLEELGRLEPTTNARVNFEVPTSVAAASTSAVDTAAPSPVAAHVATTARASPVLQTSVAASSSSVVYAVAPSPIPASVGALATSLCVFAVLKSLAPAAAVAGLAPAGLAQTAAQLTPTVPSATSVERYMNMNMIL